MHPSQLGLKWPRFLICFHILVVIFCDHCFSNYYLQPPLGSGQTALGMQQAVSRPQQQLQPQSQQQQQQQQQQQGKPSLPQPPQASLAGQQPLPSAQQGFGVQGMAGVSVQQVPQPQVPQGLTGAQVGGQPPHMMPHAMAAVPPSQQPQQPGMVGGQQGLVGQGMVAGGQQQQQSMVGGQPGSSMHPAQPGSYEAQAPQVSITLTHREVDICTYI